MFGQAALPRRRGSRSSGRSRISCRAPGGSSAGWYGRARGPLLDYAAAHPCWSPFVSLYTEACKVHSRRRQLAGARLPRRRRRPDLLRAGQGPHVWSADGRRVHRLRRLLGPDDPRPRAPGGDQAVQRDGRQRPELRRADRDRDRDGRAGSSSWCRRIEMVRMVQLRHRGDDERDPPGARLHRARQDHQVRGLLPRPLPTRCW